VIQDPKLQLRLKLMNPAIHALNILQLLVALFVAVCTLVAAWFCVYALYEYEGGAPLIQELGRATNALYYSLFFFSFYPICYFQHRTEMEYYVGTGSTVLQDILTAVAIVSILFILKSSELGVRAVSLSSLLNYIPLIVVIVGYIVAIYSPQTMRQLIGSQTNIGIQLLFMLIYASLAIVALMRILPRP